MKRYSRYLFTAIAILATATMVACSRASDVNNGNAGGGFYIGNPYGGGVTNGLYAQNANMQYIYPGSGVNLYVENHYKSFLKEAMGVCDRENYSAGTAACDAWLNGFNDIVLYTYPNKAARLVVRSMPLSCQNSNPYYCSSYYASIPKFQDMILNIMGLPTGNFAGVFNPMVLDTTYNLTNNSTGFTWRTKGPTGSRAYLQNIDIVIPSGKFEDAQHTFELHYKGQRAASGTLIRCSTPSCGL